MCDVVDALIPDPYIVDTLLYGYRAQLYGLSWNALSIAMSIVKREMSRRSHYRVLSSAAFERDVLRSNLT